MANEFLNDRGIPAPDGHPRDDQQRPALAMDAGRVYVAFGGLYGDCGLYKGSVVGIPVSGGRPVSWHTPTSNQGAVWGTAGPVTGLDGDLWISAGNGAAGPGQAYDGSDSVTRLSPALRRLDFFAPAVWAQDNANDLDLGCTQPALAAGDAAFIMGKRGVGYLLDTVRLGGIGHQLAARSICPAYGAAAVDGSTVFEPCAIGGMAAIRVNLQAQGQSAGDARSRATGPHASERGPGRLTPYRKGGDHARFDCG